MTLSADFAAFWARYPRKVEKLAAERAYAKARKMASADEIMAGLLAYPFRADRQYQPHAASWLNAGGWMVEQDTPPPTVLLERDGRRHEAAELAESLELDLITPISEQFPDGGQNTTPPANYALADQAGASDIGRKNACNKAANRPLCDDLFG